MTKHSVQFLITYLWPPVCTLPVCFHTRWWSCKHTALHLTSEPSRSSFHWCHLPSLAQWSALLSSPRLCPSAWVSIKRLSESFMLRRVMAGCLCETVSDLDCNKSFRFLLRCLAAIKPWGEKRCLTSKPWVWAGLWLSLTWQHLDPRLPPGHMVPPIKECKHDYL